MCLCHTTSPLQTFHVPQGAALPSLSTTGIEFIEIAVSFVVCLEKIVTFVVLHFFGKFIYNYVRSQHTILPVLTGTVPV